MVVEGGDMVVEGGVWTSLHSAWKVIGKTRKILEKWWVQSSSFIFILTLLTSVPAKKNLRNVFALSCRCGRRNETY